MERLTTGGGVRQSRCFVQEQPPGVVVVSTFVAGINPWGCRGCHLDCQAILARSTPSDTTTLGSSRYWCVMLRYLRLTCQNTSDSVLDSQPQERSGNSSASPASHNLPHQQTTATTAAITVMPKESASKRPRQTPEAVCAAHTALSSHLLTRTSCRRGLKRR